MTRRKLVLAGAVAPLLALAPAAPALAVQAGTGASGTISIHADHSACATVSFPSATTFAGEFSVVGVLNGPGTITVPVEGSKPVAGVNATGWTGCIYGGYSGAVNGVVTYSLHVSATTGDLAVQVVCTTTSGRTSCV